jgi:hypothetical protein
MAKGRPACPLSHLVPARDVTGTRGRVTWHFGIIVAMLRELAAPGRRLWNHLRVKVRACEEIGKI